MQAPPRLRPMGIGDLLDSTFMLYRRNFALFLGTVAVMGIPQALLGAKSLASAASALQQLNTISAGSYSTSHRFQTSGTAGQYALELLSFLLTIILVAALCRAISARYLGEEISIGQAYRGLRPSMIVNLLAVSFLFVLALAATFIIAAIIVALLTVVLRVIGLLVGTVVVTAGVLFCVVHLVLIPQAVVLERLGPIAALKRSWVLVSGNVWRTIGTLIVLLLLVSILGLVVGGVVGAIAGGATALFAGTSGTASIVAGGLAGQIAALAISPVEFGALTLLYYDLRVRKEAFDLERLVMADAPVVLSAE